MTIEQLRYFYAISENKTFSQAALEMNITQSALSKQIAKLEEELDVFLFDRSHRQVVLTKEGKQLLMDAKRILKDYDDMMIDLSAIKDELHHTIKISMLPILSQYDLSHRFKAFEESHPEIHLRIKEIEERDLKHQLEYHHDDVFIMRGLYDELKEYSSILLYEDNLVAVVPKNHHLATRHTLSFGDLKDESLLLPPEYTMISRLAVDACHKAGFNPRVIKHGRLETILGQASYGTGIALMMKKSLHIFPVNDVKIIPFEEKVYGDIMLYYSPHSPHVDVIRTFIRDMQPHSYQKDDQ